MRTIVVYFCVLSCLIIIGCKKKDAPAGGDKEGAAAFDPNQPQTVIRIDKVGLKRMAASAKESAERKAKMNERSKKAGTPVKEAPPSVSDIVTPDMFDSITAYLFYRLDDPSMAGVVVLEGCNLDPIVTNPIAAKSLKKAEDGLWTYVPDEDDTSGLGKDYGLRKVADTVWMIGPKSMIGDLDPAALATSPVAKLNQKRLSASNEFSFTCTMPPKVETAGDVVAKKMKEMKEESEDLGRNMAVGLVGAVVSSFAEQFAKYETISMGYGTNDSGKSEGKAYFAFKDDVEGKKKLDLWKSDQIPELSFDPMADVKTRLQQKKLKPTVTYEGQVLSAALTWGEDDGKDVKSAFNSLMFSMMFAGPKPVPAEWSKPAEYASQVDPMLKPVGDPEALKKELPKMIRDRLFPSSETRIELDAIPVSFSQWLRYKVIKAVDTDGNAVEPDDDEGYFTNGGDSFSLRAKDSKKKIVKATLSFTASMYSGVDVYEFDAGTPKGTIRRGKTSLCRLDVLDGNAFHVTVKGGHVRIAHPMDETGKVLARAPGPDGKKLRMWRTGSGNFCGTIKKLRLAVVKESKPITFDMELDMAALQKKTMPKEPTLDVPTRIDVHESTDDRGLTDDELEALDVTWNAKDSRISIKPPAGKYDKYPSGGLMIWKGNAITSTSGSFGNYDGAWEGRLRDSSGKKIEDPEIVAGAYVLVVPERYKLVELVSKGDATIKKALNDTDTVTARFTKNHVELGYFKKGKKITSKWDVPKMSWARVYDKDGNSLKTTPSLNFTEKVACWGVPQKVVLRIPVNVRTHSQTFAIATKDGVPQSKVDAAKVYFENTLRMVATAWQALRITSQRYVVAGYADDFAHRHFLAPKGKQIPLALAQSDPDGATRFGYTVKPFKGYHFTFPKGTIDDKGKTKPFATEKKGTVQHGGKTIEFSRLSNQYDGGAVLLIPVDKSMPHISVRFDYPVKIAFSKEELRYAPGRGDYKDWQDFSLDLMNEFKPWAYR